jgi:peptidoglycan/LPS O-acetylase OafA/YrhL
VLGVAWTLVYEVFFYALFGVFIVNRRAGVLLFLAWTAGMIAYPWLSNELSPFVFNNLNLRFVAGICVALLLARWSIPFPRLVAGAGAAVFLGFGMAESYAGPLSPWTQALGFTLGSALMVAGLVQAERDRSAQPPRWLVDLGNASYSIYLVHFLSLSVMAKVATGMRLDAIVPLPLLFWLHVAGAVGVGCFFLSRCRASDP